MTRVIRAIFFALIAALLFATCEPWGPLDNPTDSGAANYQGFDTVTSPDAIAAALPADKGTLSGTTLTVTKVLGATSYELRIATSAAALDSSPLFSKADYSTNVMDISASGIQDKTSYWWKVRATAGGKVGAWSAALSFTTSYLPAATPTFSPAAGAYTTDQRVTIACTTAGSTIYYTTDGSAPTTGSTKYTGPVTVKTGVTTTIQAIATGAPLYLSSAVTTARYNGLLTMVSVPAGSFNNGTSTVTLSAFKMSTYEVTQAQYQTVTSTNPSYFTGDTTRPVEQVTWYDAVEFCNLLSTREGRTPVYTIAGRSPATGYPITSATVTQDLTKNGYRLPTEAQWEYAARGGNSTHGYTYAGSNAIDAVAWCTSNSGSTTHAVGGKAANELGLYDMSGNVWEWCWDWYGSYASGAQTDPLGAASGTYRVIRGGSWYSDASYFPVSGRYVNFPYYRDSNVGFRVVAP